MPWRTGDSGAGGVGDLHRVGRRTLAEQILHRLRQGAGLRHAPPRRRAPGRLAAPAAVIAPISTRCLMAASHSAETTTWPMAAAPPPLPRSPAWGAPWPRAARVARTCRGGAGEREHLGRHLELHHAALDRLGARDLREHLVERRGQRSHAAWRIGARGHEFLDRSGRSARTARPRRAAPAPARGSGIRAARAAALHGPIVQVEEREPRPQDRAG